jgi:hypothetical protein
MRAAAPFVIALLLVNSGSAQAPPATTSGRCVSCAAGELNPDHVTAATTVIFARDYETELARDFNDNFGSRGGTIYAWDKSYGYGGTGGWRQQPDPAIGGNGESEEVVGWAMPDARSFPVDAYELVVTSFMLKITGELLDEIARGGSFWNHPNKVLDFRCWNTAGTGEGCRNGFHFGESPPRWFFSIGGAGQVRPGVGADWRKFADEWVWVALVVDMRGDTGAGRRLAIYYKGPEDADVQKAGEIGWERGRDRLEPYDGRGFHSYNFGNTLFGYWDDMVGRQSVTGDLSAMHVYLDRVRITNGWPTGADGPPGG